MIYCPRLVLCQKSLKKQMIIKTVNYVLSLL
nr:MAG TPA: hypothetical protein [Caudoviricetes sp.]